jgi:hypothetical protein
VKRRDAATDKKKQRSLRQYGDIMTWTMIQCCLVRHLKLMWHDDLGKMRYYCRAA